jgi:hypothetical protein
MVRNLITVVETSAFARRAEKLLSADEHDALITLLAEEPMAGDEIPGTGGVRKLRFGAQGKGKSGGARVIYYFYDQETPLYAIFIYGKGEQADLSPDQAKAVSDLAAGIKAAAKARSTR